MCDPVPPNGLTHDQALLVNQEVLTSLAVKQRNELAMLVRRLLRRLPKDDALALQAYDYLVRHNLTGSPIERNHNGT